ncbi:MAG: class I SAM-dependent methyltransferase [bacterium]|nr:class I SAM-dependent methyltransferase [bacterium]
MSSKSAITIPSSAELESQTSQHHDGLACSIQDNGRKLLLQLFSRSVLKQEKLRQIKLSLPEINTQKCLDLGADNGVISYLLRADGGTWWSADLTPSVVAAIRRMVDSNVALVTGPLPYEDSFFDVVVVIDMLEHVEDDRYFINELSRILKPGGLLIINAPNLKRYSLLRIFRNVIGQTDEAHGHLRPGYDESALRNLTKNSFKMSGSRTYSGFFSETIDTLIVYAYSLIAGKKPHSETTSKKDNCEEASKGLVITENELRKFEKNFRLYSKIYPFVKMVSRLDKFLYPFSGYMRISTFVKN